MLLKRPMNYSASKTPDENFRSGMVALAGRPNVGKSTLLNRLLGQKVSITSKKANTTRFRILGVLNDEECQFVFVDLPGFNTKFKRLVDYSIHKTASAGISGTDLVLFIVESKGWHSQDSAVWRRIQSENIPTIVVISKIDRMEDKSQLLPIMKELTEKTGVTEIIPISAKKGENLTELKSTISQFLPIGPPLFPLDYVTDRDKVFQTAELVREQVFRFYGDEIPYACAVQIEKYEYEGEVLHVHALILVESSSQKKIIIGSGGEKVKRIGTLVRKTLESQLGGQVYLKLWVKVRTQWTDDQHLISNFGLSEAE